MQTARIKWKKSSSNYTIKFSNCKQILNNANLGRIGLTNKLCFVKDNLKSCKSRLKSNRWHIMNLTVSLVSFWGKKRISRGKQTRFNRSFNKKRTNMIKWTLLIKLSCLLLIRFRERGTRLNMSFKNQNIKYKTWWINCYRLAISNSRQRSKSNKKDKCMQKMIKS